MTLSNPAILNRLEQTDFQPPRNRSQSQNSPTQSNLIVATSFRKRKACLPPCRFREMKSSDRWMGRDVFVHTRVSENPFFACDCRCCFQPHVHVHIQIYTCRMKQHTAFASASHCVAGNTMVFIAHGVNKTNTSSVYYSREQGESAGIGGTFFFRGAGSGCGCTSPCSIQ